MLFNKKICFSANAVEYYAKIKLLPSGDMKKLLIFLSVILTVMPVPAQERASMTRVSSNFNIVIPDDAGHQVPIVDFMRRFERIVRNVGRFGTTDSAKTLTVVISLKQTPGTCYWSKNSEYGKNVLVIPNGMRQLLASPEVGRALTSALIQCRIGNPPSAPLPEEALWIADGLWAEFIQREIQVFPVLHFTYLENLRKLSEMDCKLRFDLPSLMPPQLLKPHTAVWDLYTQRAQLMLEVCRYLAPGRHGNLIKDYLFLLNGKKLSAQDSFTLTFAHAAYKKLYAGETAPRTADDPRSKKGYTALEKLALRNLFSRHSPMSPAALIKRLNQLNVVWYRQHEKGQLLKAALTDLPLLVSKYDTCSKLPQQKLQELNEFVPLLPLQLHGEASRFAMQLSQIGSVNHQRQSEELKKIISSLQRKLAHLQLVDRELEYFENISMPHLYYLRYQLNTAAPETPLPPDISNYLDLQQQKLQQD